MADVARTWHTTDEPVSIVDNVRKRRRTIGNWLNYRDQAGSWHETNLSFTRTEAGDTFLGRQLEWVSSGAPLQWFVGDASEAAGLPWFGFRKSDDTDSAGIVSYVKGADASGGYTLNGAEKSATWEDIIPDVDLILYAGVNKIERWVALHSAVTDRFDLGFILPDGWTLEVEDSATPGNRILIKNPAGKVRFSSKPARAYDQRLDAEGNPGPVPCTFITRPQETIGPYTSWMVRKRIDPTGVVYPLLMDDTVTIGPDDGTSGIVQDSWIGSGGNAGSNFGSSAVIYTRASDNRKALIRIVDTTEIPDGTITSCKMFGNWRDDNPAISCWRITDGNVWVEGRGSGVPLTGEVTYNERQHATASWLGSAGCSTAGTDFDTSQIGTLAAGPGGVSYSTRAVSLDTAAAEGWRDTGICNGILMTSGPLGIMNSSEQSYDRPYWEIEYSEPVAASGQPVEYRDPIGGRQPSRRPVRRPSRNPRW